MGKNNSKITRVCIVDSVYSLLLYLLYSNEDELKQTYYFFSSGIDPKIRVNFPKYFYLLNKPKGMIKKYMNYIFLLILFFFLRICVFPFLRKSSIYGHDHLMISPFVIGKQSYTLIEDSPMILSIYLKSTFRKKYIKGIKKRILNIFISNVFGNPMGESRQCKEVILSCDDNAAYINDKVKHIMSLRMAWNNSTEKKKNCILSVYNITESDVSVFKNKKNLLLVEAFSTEGYVTEQEQVEIYKKIIGNYDADSLIIKTHPRDKLNYKYYFPDIVVFDKPVPLQLLLLCGLDNIRKAITICSSSVQWLPASVEVDWIGTSIHPKLKKILPEAIHNIYKHK